MDTAVWIIQVLLAAVFGMLGIMKSIEPIDKLVISGLTWTERFSPRVVRLIGLGEILGAIGIVAPYYWNIFPMLTSAAAICLGVMMIAAIVHHLKHKEYKDMILCMIIGSASFFVAFWRF